MKVLFLLASLLPFSVAAAAQKKQQQQDDKSSSSSSSSTPQLPPCRYMTPDTVPVYHTDAQCDRVAHNDPSRRLRRASRELQLRAGGGIAHVPNQRTIVCPLELTTPAVVPMMQTSHGHDTLWIVENRSSGPIVLAHVKPDGTEWSAMTSTITPPQADPRAILQPGEWKSVTAFEGHVFYARELLEDGATTGDVLLQHQPGLIGFTNRYHKELPCEDDDVVVEDPEPVIEIQRNKHSPKPKRIRDPRYARTANQPFERCNIIYQGFRNMLPNCPLNVYYAGMQEATSSDGPMTCREDFKFHLGLEERGLTDYMNQWTSRTKYESTFVGHTFVARLASDPNVTVDHVTLQPTRVHDCPKLKKEEQAVVTAQGTVETTMVHPPVGVWSNNLTTDVALMMMQPTNQTAHVWASMPFSS